MRVTLNSAEFFSSASNLLNSSSMAALATAGMTPSFHFSSADSSSEALSTPSMDAILFLNFFTSASLSSVSTPSSFLMVFSCSFNRNVRCWDESFVSTCWLISCWSLLNSRSCETKSRANLNLFTTSRSSSATCRSGPLAVANEAAKSANLKGSAMSTRCVKYCICSRYKGLSCTNSRIAATISLDRALTRSPGEASFFLRPVLVGGMLESSSSTQASRGQCSTPNRGGGPASTTVEASTLRWTNKRAWDCPSLPSATLWTCAKAPVPCTTSKHSSRSEGVNNSAASCSSAGSFLRKRAT